MPFEVRSGMIRHLLVKAFISCPICPNMISLEHYKSCVKTQKMHAAFALCFYWAVLIIHIVAKFTMFVCICV